MPLAQLCRGWGTYYLPWGVMRGLAHSLGRLLVGSVDRITVIEWIKAPFLV